MLDFVFMLTRADQTVPDCLQVLADIAPLGLRHIGFKDVGVDPEVLGALNQAIKATGATSYMEVVSTSRETCLESAMLRGRIQDVSRFADSLVAEQGVRHGMVNLIPVALERPHRALHGHRHYKAIR